MFLAIDYWEPTDTYSVLVDGNTIATYDRATGESQRLAVGQPALLLASVRCCSRIFVRAQLRGRCRSMCVLS